MSNDLKYFNDRKLGENVVAIGFRHCELVTLHFIVIPPSITFPRKLGEPALPGKHMVKRERQD
jgi:hypothetical protein